MKLLKKLTTMMLGAALLCTLVLVPNIKSHADGPVTWYITYNAGDWYCSNNTVDYWTSASWAAEAMKDGDHLVFNGNNQTGNSWLEYKVDKRVGDLVATNGAYVNCTANGANKVYIAGQGSILVANVGHAENVEVWPNQTIQILGNVTNFLAHYAYDGTYPHYAVSGWVKAANVNHTGAVDSSYYTIYGIAAGLFTADDVGMVPLKEGQFSLVPVEMPVSGTTGTPAASQPAQKQLDKVPQTGAFASTETIVFLMLAAVFGGAAIATASVVKKRA